ncbi:MAG: hypothetical protein IT372_13400 [Polyangiaceae bacterium]|nr:hypothetical protein [Polyangiaceae bacterium]
MSLICALVIGSLLVTLTAVAVVLVLRVSRMRDELGAALDRSRALAVHADGLRRDLALRVEELGRLELENRRALAEEARKDEWLRSLEQDNAWVRAELESRPRRTRRPYRILTLGVKHTGKTSLTLKWANPLVDLGALKGTKIERYERTVSHVLTGDMIVEHVFEIGDWGGEHLADAQAELVLEEIHGMLLVVDLAGSGGKAVDRARIEEQLRAFQPQVLQYFFGPKTLACCKAVVLFINKSDVLSGTPAEVEQIAVDHYRKLIDDLSQYRSRIDVRVLVGSASYGHSTHHLFAHFVERILPKSAYDAQLLQRLKAEAEPARPARPPAKPGRPAGEVNA